MNTLEQEMLSKLVTIYNPNGYDWMGTPITKNNPLTYHHIVKRDEGNTTLENGALLTKSSHRKLNMLESKDIDLYNEWNWLFYAINYSETHPSYALSEMMYELKDQTDKIIYGKEKMLELKQKRITQ